MRTLLTVLALLLVVVFAVIGVRGGGGQSSGSCDDSVYPVNVCEDGGQ